MIFLHPFVFLLLPLYWFCERRCFAPTPRLVVARLPMLLEAAGSLGSRERWLRWAIVVLMVSALATPVVKKELTLHNSRGYAIALLLDASYSMREGNRFETAKKVLSDFIRRRPDDRIALEVFGDYAHLAAPMSYDKRGLLTILDYLKPGVAGGRDTALVESLFAGSRLFEREGAGSRIMILLTDGIDTVKNIPLELAIRELKEKKIRVYTIGVGDDFRREILRKIAEATGGRFFSAADAKKLRTIYTTIDRLEKSPVETVRITEYRHYYRWPLAAAVMLLLLLLGLKIRQRRGIGPIALTLAFSLIALYGPTLQGKSVGVLRSGHDLIIAIDATRSMDARDLYPDRFRFALHKLRRLLEDLKDLKVGILLFADRVYLLAPPTGDRKALEALLDRLDLNGIERKGGDWQDLITAAAKLKEGSGSTPLLVFSDGGGAEDIEGLAAEARSRGLDLYLYATATPKGATIPDGKELLRDARGDVVVSRLNPRLPELARRSGGVYFEAENDDGDMKRLAEMIAFRYGGSAKSGETVRREKQLFGWPLTLALLIFVFPWKRFRRKK